MTKQLPNGLIAGAIAGVLSFLAWRFLADASWGHSFMVGLGFFAGTLLATMLIANFVRAQVRARRK